MSISLPSIHNNPSALYTRDIAQICTPLFRNTKINHFAYYRLFKDKSYYALCTDFAWTEHFYHKQYRTVGYNGKPFQSGIYLMRDLAKAGIIGECIEDMEQGFNLHNMILLLDNYPDFIDLYAVGTPRLIGENYINFYLNNMDIIKNFFAYFKEKTSEIVPKVSSSRILVPEQFHKKFNILEMKSKENYSDIRRNILHDIGYKNVNTNFISKMDNNVTLTPQEFNCIHFAIRGMTAKMIAKKMNISPRTVEFHLKNLKNKFNVQSKFELMSKLIDYLQAT